MRMQRWHRALRVCFPVVRASPWRALRLTLPSLTDVIQRLEARRQCARHTRDVAIHPLKLREAGQRARGGAPGSLRRLARAAREHATGNAMQQQRIDHARGRRVRHTPFAHGHRYLVSFRRSVRVRRNNHTVSPSTMRSTGPALNRSRASTVGGSKRAATDGARRARARRSGAGPIPWESVFFRSLRATVRTFPSSDWLTGRGASPLAWLADGT